MLRVRFPLRAKSLLPLPKISPIHLLLSHSPRNIKQRRLLSMSSGATADGSAAAALARQIPTRSHELYTCTIRSSQYSYAHLQVIKDNSEPVPLDDLQVRAYCTSALRRFLGDTGVAISIDILKVEGSECWLRVPRPDLGAFAAAITAWPGTVEEGSPRTLRVLQCSDWLGSMVGSYGQSKLWGT